MFISIITPVYNREKEIKVLYESIVDNDKELLLKTEWIIVDDGSVDNIKGVINEFIADDRLVIKYIKKENGGKHTALNVGFSHARGEYITIIDSDDYLLPNGLDIIIKNSYSSISIFKHAITQSSDFKKKLYTLDEFLGIRGDRLFVFKRDILIKYQFPEHQNEKFVTESVVFNKIFYMEKANCFNYEVVSGEYLPNGLSDSYQKLLKNSPLGVFDLIDTNLKFDMLTTEILKQTAFHFAAIFTIKNIYKVLVKYPLSKSIRLILATAYVLIKRSLKN
ncbi:glycosyltransferase family 2 protein [Photobacterium piscicola]|uniref:glycosyltransferase family 2 protein n=1 Tax=Photobacterium piscicola TaxID=1378299 RepID=UPI0038D14E5A